MAFQRDQGYDLADPLFATDDFRCFRYKVELCPRVRPHDWTQCPYAHPQEKAKRRDPQKFKYSGTACQTFRKNGSCERGDSCPYAHGVFECWLHPARYRTQLCTDGERCARRVCFFAHRQRELRTQPVDAAGDKPATAGSDTLATADVPMVLNALKKLLVSAPQTNDPQAQALQQGILALLAQQQQQTAQPTASAPLQEVPSPAPDVEVFRTRAQPLMEQLANNSELQQTMLQALVEQELNREQGYDRNMYASEHPQDADDLEQLEVPLPVGTVGVDNMPGLVHTRNSLDGRPPMMGMYAMGSVGDHHSLLQARGQSTVALTSLLGNTNGYVVPNGENQRRSVDLGEMARRRTNMHMNGHVPMAYPTVSAAGTSSGDASGLYVQDPIGFHENQNSNLQPSRAGMAAYNPSSAANAAASLLLDRNSSVHQRRALGQARLGVPVAPVYASGLFQPSGQGMGGTPLQQYHAPSPSYSGLVAQLALQRSSGRGQRTSLDLPPHGGVSAEPHRYSVDSAGGYSPALPNSVPVAEAALIAGPDGYSRIAYRGITGGAGPLPAEEGFVHEYGGYQGFVDPSMHGSVATYSQNPTSGEYGLGPVPEPAGFVSLRDELAFEALVPAPHVPQNGHTRPPGLLGASVSVAPLNGQQGLNLGALQALQQLSLGQAVKQPDAFDQHRGATRSVSPGLAITNGLRPQLS